MDTAATHQESAARRAADRRYHVAALTIAWAVADRRHVKRRFIREFRDAERLANDVRALEREQ